MDFLVRLFTQYKFRAKNKFLFSPEYGILKTTTFATNGMLAYDSVPKCYGPLRHFTGPIFSPFHGDLWNT